jgi:hypothetical protein
MDSAVLIKSATQCNFFIKANACEHTVHDFIRTFPKQNQHHTVSTQSTHSLSPFHPNLRRALPTKKTNVREGNPPASAAGFSYRSSARFGAILFFGVDPEAVIESRTISALLTNLVYHNLDGTPLL